MAVEEHVSIANLFVYFNLGAAVLKELDSLWAVAIDSKSRCVVESVVRVTRCRFVRLFQRAQADEVEKIDKHIKSTKEKEGAKPLDKPEQ